MTSAQISVHQLEKAFEGTPAVRGISFEVPAGQICGFLGPNGAGKSTTIRIIAGLLTPTGGSASIAGHDVVRAPMEAKRKLGFVPESGALYSLLSGREHLTLISDLYELEPVRAAQRMNQLFEMFDIAKVVDRRIDTLSKGQKQKVALCTAFLHDPQVLLLDEPLNGLDVRSTLVLKQLMTEIAARGGTIFYSSHILDVVERVCDRTIIIDQGAIVADAPTAELLAGTPDARLESVFRSLVRSDDVEGLAGAFVEGARA